MEAMNEKTDKIIKKWSQLAVIMDSTEEYVGVVLIWFSFLNDRYRSSIRSLDFYIVVGLISVMYFTVSEKADVFSFII